MGWAHFSDVGGIRPGSISPDATEHLPGRHHHPADQADRRGARRTRRCSTIFYRNSRYPETCRGDTRALMAAVELGVKRMEEIVARFGTGTLADALAQLLERTEADRAAEAARDISGRHASLHRCASTRMAMAAARFRSASRSPARRMTVSSSMRPKPTIRVGGAGQFPDEPRRAGHGARPLLPRRRSEPGRQCRRSARDRRGAIARRLAAAARASPPRSACAG